MARSTRRFVITAPAAILASVSMALTISTASAVAQAIAPEDAPLQGFVVAEWTGEVITSARVTIIGTEMETRTDEAGTFAFADPPLGDVSLRVEAQGYPAVVDQAEVRPNEVVYVYVLLPQVQIMLGELANEDEIGKNEQTIMQQQARREECTEYDEADLDRFAVGWSARLKSCRPGALPTESPLGRWISDEDIRENMY